MFAVTQPLTKLTQRRLSQIGKWQNLIDDSRHARAPCCQSAVKLVSSVWSTEMTISGQTCGNWYLPSWDHEDPLKPLEQHLKEADRRVEKSDLIMVRVLQPTVAFAGAQGSSIESLFMI
jgi:hypothetical protein